MDIEVGWVIQDVFLILSSKDCWRLLLDEHSLQPRFLVRFFFFSFWFLYSMLTQRFPRQLRQVVNVPLLPTACTWEIIHSLSLSLCRSMYIVATDLCMQICMYKDTYNLDFSIYTLLRYKQVYFVSSTLLKQYLFYFKITNNISIRFN